MEAISCTICNKEIAVGDRNIYFCNICGKFCHSECESISFSGCEFCGSSATGIDRRDKVKKNSADLLITKFNQIKKYEFEAGNDQLNSLHQLSPERRKDIQQKVFVHGCKERIAGIIALIFLLFGGIVCMRFAFPISEASIYIFFLLFFIGLLSFWCFYKTLLEIIKPKKSRSPTELAQKYYKEALTGDPINTLKLLELLTPEAIDSLEGDWPSHLMNSWYSVRDNIAQVFGKKVDGLSINRVIEDTAGQGDAVNFTVEVMCFYYDEKNECADRDIFRFKNAAIKKDDRWLLTSPIPGKMVKWGGLGLELH